jgi:hypothetical protein
VTVQSKFKRAMHKLPRGNHSKLICDTTAHLHSEFNAEEKFVVFDIFGVTMGINQFQQACRSLLYGILVTARPTVKEDMCSHMRLEVSTPQETKDLGQIVRDETVPCGIVFRRDFGDLPPWKIGVDAVEKRRIVSQLGRGSNR